MNCPTRKLPAACFTRGIALLLLSLLWPVLTAGAPAGDLREEYFERLGKLPPRSAAAHVELGDWCARNGLDDYAAACYRRAISIDTDCRRAREELGYRRYGTLWIQKGEKPPQRVSRSSSRKPVEPPQAGSESLGGSPLEEEPSPVGPPPSEPPEAAEAGEPRVTKPEPELARVSSRDLLEQAIQKKRERATAAGEKIAATFTTYEDSDFLIHTTLPGSSRELKLLVNNLKALKKTLAGVLGTGSSTRMWPDKLQFFLLESNPEYTRFAELVDGLRAGNLPEGGYTTDDYTVVLSPDSEILPRLLGQTALSHFKGSKRYVGWWLQDGLGEWMFAQSPAGLASKYYATTFLYAAEVLAADGPSLKIFDLIETPDYRSREAGRNKALAFTLIEFLLRTRRRALPQIVAELKSEEAPEPAATEEEFKSFYVSYVSFQEEVLVDACRATLNELGEKWKLFVAATAEALKAQAATAPEPPRRRGR